MAKIKMRTIMVPKLVPVTLIYSQVKLKPAKRKKRQSILTKYFTKDSLSYPQLVFDEFHSWPTGKAVEWKRFE